MSHKNEDGELENIRDTKTKQQQQNTKTTITTTETIP